MIEFDWKLAPRIVCIIEATGEDCNDYLTRGATGDSCIVDVIYEYLVSNTGTKCERLLEAKSDITIPPPDFNLQSIGIPLADFSESELLFCPEDVLLLSQPTEQDLCAKANKEVDFEVTLNSLSNDAKRGSIVFVQNGAGIP